ncbi:unnamed protein product [Rotaria sordida]|uniref:F-box domain-containing protein n=1 Tax=Rotaria sordida TaxID=392033 RepID=A0A819IR23_9BILA|nr:unnamed protein product [Rotaria sordida]
MDTHTHLEDLSNEIFFEIFDYLHALDIFTAFASLNKRILSILKSISLHVIILNSHYDREIQFLSSHLTFHAHQVVSLYIYDTIRDRSSIISLLFNRHHFINLQSCKFISINSSTELDNVIKQVKSLNRLVTFVITQPIYQNNNKKYICDITRTILMHKSSSLRSVMLRYNYDYLDISTYTSIASNLISLDLLMSGTLNIVSLYSILPILRVCHRIRYLHVIINHQIIPEYVNLNVSIRHPFINENNLPISPQVTTFDLSTFGICDFRSIAYILRCMPNLIRFKFLHGTQRVPLPVVDNLVNGYAWQQMLETYVPFLSKFDFFISILKKYRKLDLDMVVNSFQHFVEKYPKWQMIIDRWVLASNMFHTQYLQLNMGKMTPRITSFPLFQHIKCLVIYMPIILSSSSNNSLNIVNSVQSNDNDDLQQCVTYLSHVVHLPNVNQIGFQSYADTSRWKDIQFILQACPNLINLTISPLYLVLSEFIDNQFLISIFKKIKFLKAILENRYVPLNFVSKLVQRFPSLTGIELEVFSFNDCVSTIDILLSHLKNLSYLKIYYKQVSLLDHPFSRNYIIDKRREAFGFNIIDEHKVIVKRNGESVEIRLS